MARTWKCDIYRGGWHGGYLEDCDVFAQCSVLLCHMWELRKVATNIFSDGRRSQSYFRSAWDY